MTDIEIDKALALVIGWREDQIVVGGALFIEFNVNDFGYEFRSFSHRDWNVIGPIAEKYNAFPTQSAKEAWSACVGDGNDLWVDDIHTPQKAIALAVIGAKK